MRPSLAPKSNIVPDVIIQPENLSDYDRSIEELDAQIESACIELDALKKTDHENRQALRPSKTHLKLVSLLNKFSGTDDNRTHVESDLHQQLANDVIKFARINFKNAFQISVITGIALSTATYSLDAAQDLLNSGFAQRLPAYLLDTAQYAHSSYSDVQYGPSPDLPYVEDATLTAKLGLSAYLSYVFSAKAIPDFLTRYRDEAKPVFSALKEAWNEICWTKKMPRQMDFDFLREIPATAEHAHAPRPVNH